MNKVNNRKMFAKRDARNKLAEMGGILASSPDLLGTVQKFADGGSPYTSQYDSYLSQYQPDGNAPFGTSDRRLMESPQQYNMNRPLPTDAEIQYANTMAQQDSRRTIMDKILQRPATFSPSESGEEENENIVRAQLIERFGDRVADNILNQAKQLRAKAKILGQGVNVLTSYIPEAVGIVQSVVGFSEAGAQRLEGAGELRQDALDKMESSSYDLLDLQRTKNLSPEDRLRKLNAEKETASQVEYEAGLPALREKLSALEGNDPMGMLSDTFVGKVQRPEGGYSTEMSNLSPAPGQAEAIFGTGAGARFAGSEFTDFEQLAKDNPEMMAANYGMLQDQDQMTNQGIINSLDPASRAALSAQQDLTREEFLNRMPEPSGNVTPLSKDLQLNTLPSEQALAEAGDYNMARDIGAANEAAAMFNQPGGINSQGPNPEVTPGYVFDRELFEANALKNKENQTVIDNAAESLLKATTEDKNTTNTYLDAIETDPNKLEDQRLFESVSSQVPDMIGPNASNINEDAAIAVENKISKNRGIVSTGETAKYPDGTDYKFTKSIPRPKSLIDLTVKDITGKLSNTAKELFSSLNTSNEQFELDQMNADDRRETVLNRVEPVKTRLQEIGDAAFPIMDDGLQALDAWFDKNYVNQPGSDGKVITTDKNGEVITTDKNGKVITTDKNGKVITTDKNGEDLKGPVSDANVALNNFLGGGGLSTKTSSLAEKNKEMQKLYQEMFGEDEKEVAAAKWNQLAMVGFAIAAGKDPNALTNVAAGLLAGAKQTKADVDRRAKRKDKIKMAAFGDAVSLEAAETKFARDLTLANIKSGIKSRAYRFPSDAYQDALKLYGPLAITSNTTKKGEKEITDTQWAVNQARKLIQDSYTTDQLEGTKFEGLGVSNLTPSVSNLTPNETALLDKYNG